MSRSAAVGCQAYTMILRAGAFFIGLVTVWFVLVSAIRTVVLPRPESVTLTRLGGLVLFRLFSLLAGERRSFAARDHVLALFGPVSILTLPFLWATLLILGFSGILWALEVEPWSEALIASGTSFTTLGHVRLENYAANVVAFVAGFIGLIIVALVITYLPTVYGAFQRRELAVTLMSTYAGTPPAGETMLLEFHQIAGVGHLQEMFRRWEELFADLEESHTTFSTLNFFRSPDPSRSWVTAAGAVLDAAAITASSLTFERPPRAELCLRSGSLALQGIASCFLALNPADASADAPISVTREEFDQALDRLAEANLPVKSDRIEAWEEFQYWRGGYDRPLIGMCGLLSPMAAKWSSDRAPIIRPTIIGALRRGRRYRADIPAAQIRTE